MVFNFRRTKSKPSHPVLLSDLKQGDRGILGEFDLPEQVADQLMNLGFVPGLEVTVAGSGPGGDPRIYRVDGTEVALRSELARCMRLRPVEHVSSSAVKAKAAKSHKNQGSRRALRKKPVAKLVAAPEAQEASAD